MTLTLSLREAIDFSGLPRTTIMNMLDKKLIKARIPGRRGPGGLTRFSPQQVFYLTVVGAVHEMYGKGATFARKYRPKTETPDEDFRAWILEDYTPWQEERRAANARSSPQEVGIILDPNKKFDRLLAQKLGLLVEYLGRRYREVEGCRPQRISKRGNKSARK
jgi:hypothetical protein